MTIEKEHGSVEFMNLPHTVESWIMHPPAGGSLGIETFTIETPIRPVEITIKQAVKAEQVGNPLKAGCGDVAAVFHTSYPLAYPSTPDNCAHITGIVCRDFLSHAPSDLPFWEKMKSDPKILDHAESNGVPILKTDSIDSWTAGKLRTPNDYGQLLMSSLPFDHMINVARNPRYFPYLHKLVELESIRYQGGDISLRTCIDMTKRVERVDDIVLDPIDKVITHAVNTLKHVPSVGFGGDIQTLAFIIQMPGNQGAILALLRSNADEVTRIKPASDLPWLLFADNTNFLMEDQRINSEHRPEHTDFNYKAAGYWMTGAGGWRRRRMIPSVANKGLPRYTLSIFSIPADSDMQIETVTDGMIFSPFELNRSYGQLEDQKSLFHILHRYLQSGNRESYQRQITLLQRIKPEGWIIRNPDVMNLSTLVKAEEYISFLQIKKDLEQPFDDATFIGAKVV